MQRIYILLRLVTDSRALIAQLGERQTEDLKAPCSIHGQSTLFAPVYIIGQFIRYFSRECHSKVRYIRHIVLCLLCCESIFIMLLH